MKQTAKIGPLLSAKGGVVWTVAPSATVFDAITEMAERGVGALLVISEGRLLGIISERDYTRKVILKGHSSRDMRVDEIMTGDVATATAEETVEGAMRLMTERRIRHLPIVEGERVVGVVSIGDLVKWTITAQEETIAHLTNYISGGYGVVG